MCKKTTVIQQCSLFPAEFGAEDMDTGADMESTEAKVSTILFGLSFVISLVLVKVLSQYVIICATG